VLIGIAASPALISLGPSGLNRVSAQQAPLPASMSDDEIKQRLAGIIERKEYATAFTYVKVLAERGDAASQEVLARFFIAGLGTTKDEKQAVFWLRKAADQGNATAEVKLGRAAYRDGELGLAVDNARAFELLSKAAAQNDAEAIAALGFMHERGKAVPLDYAKAMELYLKAADRNDFAQAAIGRLYLNGWGVQKDSAKAAEWFHKAAQNGMPEAQTQLAGMYMEGNGVPKDLGEAVKWFRKAAEQGDDWGEYGLGTMYHEGLGVRRDLAQARVWYKKAADQGHAKAKAALARMDQEKAVTPASLRDRIPPAIQYRCVLEGAMPAAKTGDDAAVSPAYVVCVRKEWKRLFPSTPFPGDQ
jgi:TPR repeat protein